LSRLIVYAGPNGAGKSTLRDITVDPVEIVIDPDRIARDLDPLAPHTVQVEAGRAAILLFNRCLADHTSMSLETTLTGASVLKRMQAARQAGFHVSLLYVALSSVEMHLNRIAHRVSNGGHHIPEETVLRRYEASLDNLPKALGCADEAIVIDNSGPEKHPLLFVRAGKIIERAVGAPEWFARRWPAIEAALARSGS